MIRHPAQLHKARWRALRLVVFARDGYRCRACGKSGRLECDHVRPIHRGGAPWEQRNLQALCRGCHIEKSRGENVRRKTRTDPARAAWRKLVSEIAT